MGPMAILNHCGHAWRRQWQPALQKLDRTGITIGLMPGTWALSQNVPYTAFQVLFGCSIIFVMWAGPKKYRDSEILATSLVGVGILFALLGMLFRDSFDFNLIPAGGALLVGFMTFQIDPFGVWTDA